MYGSPPRPYFKCNLQFQGVPVLLKTNPISSEYDLKEEIGKGSMVARWL